MRDYSLKQTIKCATVTGLASLVISGCGWVPTVGIYPLGPDKEKNERIAQMRADRIQRDIDDQMRTNKFLGLEPDYRLTITIGGLTKY
jgi:hypothetical protein